MLSGYCSQGRPKQFETGVARMRIAFPPFRKQISTGGGAIGNFFRSLGVQKLKSLKSLLLLFDHNETGVAKAYHRHTTFQTGVATATSATPLPAPLTALPLAHNMKSSALKLVIHRNSRPSFSISCEVAVVQPSTHAFEIKQ